MIELEVDAEQLEEARRRLQKVPYALQRAIIPAVHEMMQGVTALLSEHLEAEIPLPDAVVRRSLHLGSVEIRGNRVMGVITVRSKKHIPLFLYDAQPSDKTAKPGLPSKSWPGFSYALRAGERRSSNLLIGKGASLPFIAEMPGGHVGVYVRTGYSAGVRQSGLWGKGRRGVKDHEAIKEIFGPDVQYHVADPAVEGEVLERASAEFPAILARHVDRAIAEFGGGA